MNLRLKNALQRSPLRAYEIARKAGLHPTALSQIVHEYRQATGTERRSIAEALEHPESDLFDEPAAIAEPQPR